MTDKGKFNVQTMDGACRGRASARLAYAQGWERGEEYVRAWTSAHGDAIFYVGSVVGRTDRKLGNSKVDVPTLFYKIIVDPRTGQGLVFVTKNEATPQQSLARFPHPVAYIEQLTNLTFPLPGNFTLATARTDAQLKAWRTAKKDKCS